jgi:hypothetical protein
MAKRQPLPDVLGNILTERPPTTEVSGSTTEHHNISSPSLDAGTPMPVRERAEEPSVPSQPSIEHTSITDDNEIGKTKATFYLSREITQALEETWLHLRRRSGKRRPASKSVLVEVALRMTLDKLKESGVEVSQP